MVIPLAIAAGLYVFLTGLVFQRREGRRAEAWLLAFCSYSAFLMAFHMLILSEQIAIPIPPGTATAVGLLLSLTLFAFLSFAYLQRILPPAWGAVGLAWIAGVIVAAVQSAPAILSAQFTILPALSDEITLVVELTVLAWLLLSVVLGVVILRAFLTENLPLSANRILVWAVITPILLMGDLLSAWITPPWNLLGYGLRLLSVIGIVYAVTSHQVLDFRTITRWVFSRGLLTLVTALIILGSLVTLIFFPMNSMTSILQWLAVVGLALLTALIVEGVRAVLKRIIDRNLKDGVEIVRYYSERIYRAVELSDLANEIRQTLKRLLVVRGSYLIVGTRSEGRTLLEVIGGDKNTFRGPAVMMPSSPLYGYFVEVGRPVMQYDIQYHRDYARMDEEEKRFFASLEMDVYAPIIKDDELLGILAIGPRVNDAPFTSGELDLLATLANQTVSSLENARLITNLRRLNFEVQGLNDNLQKTNERLERLDSVKTDFISIASHELRTPLTQIQGYSALMIEMSSRGVSDPDEASLIADNLNLAIKRMTDVISSILDASHIDVESLDLNFIEAPLSNIVKLSIEPYADAIHERNLTLVARGLRNLPPIHADYQRMVQAIQNVVINAIKFTPDGGQITVTGDVFDKDGDGNPLSVKLAIQDSGVGINEEHHDLIFDKLYRIGPVSLHSTGTTKFKGAGPGLGLSISRGIIEGHGGRIWVESKGFSEDDLPGSTFYIILPVRPPVMLARQRIAQIQGGVDVSKDETVVMKRNKEG